MKKTNIGKPEFTWDDTDPEGFRAGMARLGGLFGAEDTGITVYELPAGQAVCPYHYECAEEEWLLVLSGTPTLRTPEGEERQAEEVVRHYSTLFRRPAVVGATYWGLTDDGSWLGAPSGFVRADGTPKPAYGAMHALVRGAWWLEETETVTDESGAFELDAFRGEYAVSAAGSSGAVTLSAAEPAVTAVLAG